MSRMNMTCLMILYICITHYCNIIVYYIRMADTGVVAAQAICLDADAYVMALHATECKITNRSDVAIVFPKKENP